MAERWEEIEAEFTDRWMGHSDPAALALIDACKRIAQLEAEKAELLEALRLWRDRAMGELPEACGSDILSFTTAVIAKATGTETRKGAGA